jgi:hypothetical protein
MKPIINAIKYWTNSRIEENRAELDERISNSKADWNQNNPEADNYVRNRTHWEEESEVVSVPETTLNFTATGYDGFQKLNDFDFIVGETYIVTYDSVDYECIAYIATGPGTPSVGDGAIAGAGNDGSNGEPFFITDFGGIVMGVNATGTHTVKIVRKVTTVHPLDAKYLPDDASIQSDWNEANEGSKNFIQNKPFYEKLDTLLNGMFETNEWGNAYFEPSIDLQEGQTYKVTINGDEYISVCEWNDTDGIYLPLTNSNGVYMGDIYRWGTWLHPIGLVNTTCYLKVEHRELKQIDKKFIPDSIYTLKDQVNEYTYDLRVADGTLYTVLAPVHVQDFYYNTPHSGNDYRYNITGWRGTLNGKSSTEIIFPNDPSIIL